MGSKIPRVKLVKNKGLRIMDSRSKPEIISGVIF